MLSTDCSASTGAIRKAELPSALVSCKCDTPPADREVDPSAIEQKARKSVSGLSTFQTSEANLDSHKRAIASILRSVVFGDPGMRTTSGC